MICQTPSQGGWCCHIGQGMGAYLFQPSTVSLLVTTALGLQFHLSWFLGLDIWISVALI